MCRHGAPSASCSRPGRMRSRADGRRPRLRRHGRRRRPQHPLPRHSPPPPPSPASSAPPSPTSPCLAAPCGSALGTAPPSPFTPPRGRRAAPGTTRSAPSRTFRSASAPRFSATYWLQMDPTSSLPSPRPAHRSTPRPRGPVAPPPRRREPEAREGPPIWSAASARPPPMLSRPSVRRWRSTPRECHLKACDDPWYPRG